jgi:N-acylneuraminate cytidylyltransferase
LIIVTIQDCTFIIPVRLGSSRIPQKVLLPFPPERETNLIEHKVDQIRREFPNAHIVLSCGEKPLFKLAERLDLRVSLREGKHIHGHEVGTRESICEIIKDIKSTHVIWTTVVTPLHDEVILRRSVEQYFSALREGFDSLTTGVRVYEYLWQNGQPLNYSADEYHPDSQDLPELYRLSNGIYICAKEIMDRRGYFLGDKPKVIPIPKICAIDIDDYEDYQVACSAHSWYKGVRDEFYSN